jgi:flagellar assembly protein FliH
MSEAVVARVSLLDARVRSHGFAPLRPRTVGPPSPATTGPEPETDLFALGFAEGERVASATLAGERDALLQLLAAAQALQPEPSEELAAMIAMTVEHLVAEIVGAAKFDHKALVERIGRATACIAEADGARTLWLHPDDAALAGNTELALDIHVDDTLERGAIRIDCSRGWIEDGRSIHLNALRAALGIEGRS